MASTKVDQKIDLYEVILQIFITNQVNTNIYNLKQALKRYRTTYPDRSFVCTNLDLGDTLDNLVQRWTTFMGRQYRLRISVWQLGFYSNEIRFTLLSRDIPSQEEQCPPSPEEVSAATLALFAAGS